MGLIDKRSRSPSLCIDIYRRNYCFGRYLGHRAHAPLDFLVIRFRARMTHQSLPSNERGVSTENLLSLSTDSLTRFSTHFVPMLHSKEMSSKAVLVEHHKQQHMCSRYCLGFSIFEIIPSFRPASKC